MDAPHIPDDSWWSSLIWEAGTVVSYNSFVKNFLKASKGRPLDPNSNQVPSTYMHVFTSGSVVESVSRHSLALVHLHNLTTPWSEQIQVAAHCSNTIFTLLPFEKIPETTPPCKHMAISLVEQVPLSVVVLNHAGTITESCTKCKHHDSYYDGYIVT